MVPLAILLVEDDPDCADVLAEAFRLAGHRVRMARNGAEMRREVASRKPDVLVIDANLGAEDGISLTRSLRDGPLEGVPVVLTTGRSRAEVALAARQAAIEWILLKPVDLDRLIDVINRAAGRDTRLVSSD